MKVNFKKIHKDAITPKKATDGSNGFDLVAIKKHIEFDGAGNIKYISYDTGIAITIPDGFVGLAFARSSVSNIGLTLCNGSGVIDKDYLGSISFRFYESVKNPKHYQLGERIGQLVIVSAPNFELNEVDELSDSQRGLGSYGSSGR